MALEAKVAVRDGVVVVELVGEYTRQEHTTRQSEFERMIAEKWPGPGQPLLLLLDLRGVTGALTRSGGYFHISREWGGNRNMRVAWLYSDPENEPQFHYRETVARNHGYVARAFRSEDDAMDWLTEAGVVRIPDGY